MRKVLVKAGALAVFAATIASIPSNTQAQPYYGMMGGYGMMGSDGAYNGYAMSPGMMYGYAPYGHHFSHHRGPHYHGQHMCWHRTGAGRDGGFYGSCPG